MCGIAGILKIHEPAEGPPPHPLEAIPEAWLDILDDSIKHRGPDGQGRFRDRAVRPDGTVMDIALVHRRLSIIDHAGGRQPMVHDGERLRPDLTYQPGETPLLAHEACPDRPLAAVVFNGCIYNHRELRGELEAMGHRFGTDHSDTEVLVHGWRAWGDKGMQSQLNGMYSFVLWDREIFSFQCGTDNAGEKPLLAASPCKSVFLFAPLAASISRVSALMEATDIYISDDITIQWIMRGASNAFPAGEWNNYPGGWTRWPEQAGSWGSGGGTPRLPRRGSADAFRSPSDVSDLLRHSVRTRLDADVPTGVFLSGGVDSALIAALASEVSDRLIPAYTVRIPHDQLDESDTAAHSAEAAGVRHFILDCSPNPAADLVHLIELSGMPFGDSSILPTYWIAKAASSEIKVALGGDGGDELFGGYRRHAAARWLDASGKADHPALRTRLIDLLHPVMRRIPTGLLPRRDPRSVFCGTERLIDAYCGEGYNDVWNIFARRDLNRMLQLEWDPRLAVFYPCPDRLRHDFTEYLPLDILRKTDTASMAVPIELRSPFLSTEMVHRAFATPIETLMPNGERKGLLKQVARKYLPDHIVDRPKRGFAIPVGEWFRTDYGGMRQLLHDHLNSTDPFPGLGDAGVQINMGFVRRMLREHDAAGEKSINPWHGRDHSQRLYMLLVLSIWSRWLDRTARGGDARA